MKLSIILPLFFMPKLLLHYCAANDSSELDLMALLEQNKELLEQNNRLLKKNDEILQAILNDQPGLTIGDNKSNAVVLQTPVQTGGRGLQNSKVVGDTSK